LYHGQLLYRFSSFVYEHCHIIFIVCGGLIIVTSVFLFYNILPRFLIYRFVREALGDERRIAYQKAIAIPSVILGAVVVFIGFFIFEYVYASTLLFLLALTVYAIWTLHLNKKHFGYYFPRNLKK